MPCGQGVGGFDQLEAAGDLVRRMVSEAEAVIERVSAHAR
jgi:NAD(P)H-dependent flavin oxidoreductase YrpB (nitropropane dioxygenase family)